MSLSSRILAALFKLHRAQSHSIEAQHGVEVLMADGVLLWADQVFYQSVRGSSSSGGEMDLRQEAANSGHK